VQLFGIGGNRTWSGTVFSILFTPIGRYAFIAALILVVLGSVYFKIKADAVAEIEAAATADVLKRTQNAVRAGDALNLSPDRLREPDRNERD
jgi:high-affinity K+ transport system ATPase subunit B